MTVMRQSVFWQATCFSLVEWRTMRGILCPISGSEFAKVPVSFPLEGDFRVRARQFSLPKNLLPGPDESKITHVQRSNVQSRIMQKQNNVQEGTYIHIKISS